MIKRALLMTRLSLFCVAGRPFSCVALLGAGRVSTTAATTTKPTGGPNVLFRRSPSMSYRLVAVDVAKQRARTTGRVFAQHRPASTRGIHHTTRSPEHTRLDSVNAAEQPRQELEGEEKLVAMPSLSTDLMIENVKFVEELPAEDEQEIFKNARQTKKKKKKSRNPNVSKRQIVIPEDEWPSYDNFAFTVENKCMEGTAARTGTLHTPHGDVQTPAFVFCATKAAMKGMSAETMKECGSQIILSNTYHLLVQPGGEAIQKMGGLQEATRWRGPMLTDSGGYQIFSMGHGSVGDEIKGRRGAEGGAQFEPSLVSIGEKGARFKSYYDCSIKWLTPENSIEIQRQLGADLVVVLDECTPFHVEREYTESSMHRTHRWALRSLREFIDHDDGSQALYGIVQGGVFPDLRKEAIAFVNKHPFFGIAVGGSLGADKATMHAVVKDTMANVRRDRPVHLLGIGGISDIFHGVRQGIDTFDCVHPTRLGRHGGALVKAKFWEEEDAAELALAEGQEKAKRQSPREHATITKRQFSDDHRVIDDDCGCPTCKGGYTRAYLHHLTKAGELLGGMLISQHNVYFMNELMTAIRRAIREGTLDKEEDEWLAPGLRSRDFAKTTAPLNGQQREVNGGLNINGGGDTPVNGA